MIIRRFKNIFYICHNSNVQSILRITFKNIPYDRYQITLK